MDFVARVATLRLCTCDATEAFLANRIQELKRDPA